MNNRSSVIVKFLINCVVPHNSTGCFSICQLFVLVDLGHHRADKVIGQLVNIVQHLASKEPDISPEIGEEQTRVKRSVADVKIGNCLLTRL